MTTHEPRDLTKDLLADALELQGEERRELLDQRCADDPDLRARIEDLLGAHEGAPEFLAEKAGASREEPGTVVDRYKLLQLIGEGGFGTVWMAEQREPVQRKVALKVIKLGMDSRQIVARFEAERQALALMDHPNIAKVLDGGVTESGRPYFVMEFVRGVPITEYCDRARLATRERLELFIDVCHAVQHAHQKGIIHRDIKPSNVLVTQHEGRGMPVVIDFGIAKATSGSLTAKTLFTEFRQFLGTPEYMSPEQAEMSRLDVDTRADIYSLGVLLYELVTGTTPADPAVLRSAAYEELLRIIREDDPPRPSTRISGLGDQLDPVARARSTEPNLLQRLVRGDLDWIVMKALEKDRARRYGSATAFADDVRRYLDHEPIEARAPSRAYKLRKFVRRNRVSVAAGTAVVLALLVGAAAATAGFLGAEEGRKRAADEAVASASINAFYDEMLLAIDPMRLRERPGFALAGDAMPATAPGLQRDISVDEMLIGASATVEDRFAGKPELAARVRETLGVTLLGLSRVEEARGQFLLAKELLDRSASADQLRLDLLLATSDLRSGELVRAEALARSAMEGMRSEHGADSPAALHAASTLGQILSESRDFAAAQELLEQTLEAQRRVLGVDSRESIDTLNQLATLFFWQTQPLEAEPLAREAYELSLKTLDPDDVVRVEAERGLGIALAFAMDHERAEALLRSALAKERRLLGADHQGVAITAHHLSRCLQGEDQQVEREELLREALGIVKARGEAAANGDIIRRDLAMLLFERDRSEEALDLAREGLEVASARGQADAREVHDAVQFLRLALVRTGNADEARSLAVQHVAELREHGQDPSYGWTCAPLLDLCRFLRASGMMDEAREAWQGCLNIRRSIADRPGASGDDQVMYAQLLLQPEVPGMLDADLALVYLERGEERGYSDMFARFALGKFEQAYRALGRTEEADRILQRRYDLFAQSFDGGGTDVSDLFSYGHLLLYSHIPEQRDVQRAVEVLSRQVEVRETRKGRRDLALASLATGDHGSARESYGRLIEIRHESLERSGGNLSELNGYLWALVVHPFDDLRPEATLRSALERLRPHAETSPSLLNTLGIGLWRLGEYGQARDLLEEADRLNQGQGYQRSHDRIPLAACLVALGEPERARALLEEAEEALEDPEVPFDVRVECQSLLVEVRTALASAGD